MKELESFSEVLSIDKYSLDHEWEKQPRLYYKYAELTAEAERCKNKCKDNIAIVESKLDKEIRDEYKDVKITEGKIKAIVFAHPERIKAYEEWNKASYNLSILNSALESLQQRKKALEKLVDLWSQSYFSIPKQKGHVVSDISSDNQRRRLKNKGE